MLIVNADDMGASPSTTDPVIACFAAGTITSTSAMVWMPDTDRAAALARERDLPVGLHLNFTLPFGADVVPAPVRARQLEVTHLFTAPGARPGDPHPGAAPLIAAAIADQLAQFRAQFGEPTHIDGHHHIHVARAVLAQLPRSLPIRPPLHPDSGRPFGQRWLIRRFRGPATCLAFERVHPALGGEGLAVLEPARRQVVEVMVHPTQPAERAALDGPEWRQALDGLALGSYRDLPG
jgi:predicted glycoside hydrolase/deacetylase ChbG (UPF0249 family)